MQIYAQRHYFTKYLLITIVKQKQTALDYAVLPCAFINICVAVCVCVCIDLKFIYVIICGLNYYAQSVNKRNIK